MNFFTKFGYYIIKLFNIVGMLILAIPKIPDKLRQMDTIDISKRIDTENLKDNISNIRNNVGIDKNISSIKPSENNNSNIKKSENLKENTEGTDSGIIMIKGTFTSEEKERTILILQILSASFVVLSIFSIFNFISFYIYIPLGVVIVGYILYLLYNKVKMMYSKDFPAYRDFFLMYVAVGIILELLSTNSNFTILFSFPFLPSITILIIALVAVLAVFLIFRLRYYRNFTYGTVIEGGKNTAYVKVEYDIRSNVKPDIYIVENRVGALEGDNVKLKLEEKLMSMSGNKPVSIMENVNII